MWLTTLLILALVVLAAWLGTRLGLVLVLAELIEFGLAATAASFGYYPLAALLSRTAHVAPGLANLAAFVFLLFMFQLALTLLARPWLVRWARRLHRQNSPLDKWGGALINAAKMTAAVAVGLAVFAALPLSAAQKQPVTNAPLSQWLLAATGSLQQRINHFVGNGITETLDFFTVKPRSQEFIRLGFTTTNVRVDEATEWAMLSRVNRERTARGLEPLVMDGRLRAVARDHGRGMFARGYFSHVDPEGRDPFARMRVAGIGYDAAGENLALAPTLDLAHNGLMNSPEHRSNILSPDFNRVGIGVIDGGPYGEMFVQDFTD
jgi:uncharacterized protein YkwD